MSRFETLIDSKKRRVPQVPRFFSLVGYDSFRYPFVFNYFILQGYVVYVQKNRHTYSVVCDGWIYGESPQDCAFEKDGVSLAYSGLCHSVAIDKFLDVCAILQKCYVFDFIKRPYFEYVQELIEKTCYENFSASDAEKIIDSKFGVSEQYELF